MVKVFRVEHPKIGGGLYSSNGAAAEYDYAIGERPDDVTGGSLWNPNRCPRPDHKYENRVMNDHIFGPDDIWLFAFVSRKSMLKWVPSARGRCKLDELGLILATYEVEQEALVVGLFQCVFDPRRARRTRTTPLVTRRERREQNGRN